MLDFYEPWIVVVRLEGAAGHHATPTSSSTSRGFVALEDWEHEDPTTELVKTIMERQHAGGRLFVVTGPVHRDLAKQFAAVLAGETCELLGGRRTHAGDQYVVSAGTSLREYLHVRQEAGPGPVLAAALQEAMLCHTQRQLGGDELAAGADLVGPLAEQLRLRPALLHAWWSKEGVYADLEPDKYSRRLTMVVNKDGYLADFMDDTGQRAARTGKIES